MKRIVSAIVVVVFCASIGPETSYTQTAGKRILDIQVKGNTSISTDTVLNKLKVSAGDVYDEAALNKELKRLYGLGFFADVTIDIEEHPDGVIVVFTVVEKPLIMEIEFRGNTKIKANRLKKKITIKEGDLLDLNQISQDTSAIQSYYVSEGYYKATCEYKVEQSNEGESAKLVFLINEGGVLKVKHVKFEGNKSVKSGELSKLMTTKTAWWFIRKGAYDENAFYADVARVESYYRSKGFLDVKVDSKIDYIADGKGMDITLTVIEGKQYQVGEILVGGDLKFPEEDIRKGIKMKPGDPFDYEMMKADIEAIKTFYFDKGYMNAEVNLGHKFNPDKGDMTLTYTLNSHAEVYVGKVNVIGNTKTRDKVVRREVRLFPGELYDGKKMRRSKERIYNLGYFEDVYLEPVPTNDPSVKDLNVTVKETKTGEFSFGGGYSSVDAFIGFAQIEQKNFDILGFPTFTGGGQDLRIRGEIGSSMSNYMLSWTDPWIFDYPYLFGFDLYREEHNRSGMSGYGYDERRIGGSLRLGKELTEYLYAGLIYNLEQVKISNMPEETGPALKSEVGEDLISRVTGKLTLDTRDNKFAPTEGVLVTLAGQNAGGFIGGDKDFLKERVDASIFYEFFDFAVLELKGAGGLVNPYGDSDYVPIFDRFFAGGAETIRGYEERAVGPRDSASNEAIGGEALTLGTAEVTVPVYKNIIKAATFYDVGNVWSLGDDMIGSPFREEEDLKHGAGVGVRVKTPIGPIKVDWGYPLSKNYQDKKSGQFYFSMSHGF
ncbi:MAG: outer membrane protein assembly factor BamA [Candidatus Omnitrophica bacterium]|nr:outer membrane protein assembly factor BamA [Candidatus Omnitrophota bacterium]